MRKNKDKIAAARSVGEGALSAFRVAHQDLQTSISMLQAAEDEHNNAAAEALDRAREARDLADEHQKAATKIAELIGK